MTATLARLDYRTADAGQAAIASLKALAWEREHEALVLAQMAEAMVVTPPCAVCGTPSVRIELVAPGHRPAGWEQWPGLLAGFVPPPGKPLRFMS
jgi:hypothetical protein